METESGVRGDSLIVDGNLPEITVIIPCFNSSKSIEACVNSVLGTEHPALEIIIVDDCSVDGCGELVDVISSEHPQIRSLRLSERGGPSYARHQGSLQATGEYLFFLDSDTVMERDALEHFVNSFEIADAVVGAYSPVPLNSGLVQRYKAYLNHYLFSRNGVIDYESFNTAVGGLKRSVYEEIGGFEQRIRWGMDYECEDFADRLLERHRLLLDPRICVRHQFPGFLRLTGTYFTRVSYWMERFPDHSFESGGTACKSIGLATAACAFMTASMVVLPLQPMALWCAGVFGALYLLGYRDTFMWIARRDAAFLPAGIVLNVFFNNVITIGALYGGLRRLLAPRVH